eukprot:SAG11_NODE_97_length_16960_cov_22.407405_10_plen_140_part_00
MAAAEGVGTNKSDHFAIIEAHLVEDPAHVRRGLSDAVLAVGILAGLGVRKPALWWAGRTISSVFASRDKRLRANRISPAKRMSRANQIFRGAISALLTRTLLKWAHEEVLGCTESYVRSLGLPWTLKPRSLQESRDQRS